MIVVDTTVLVYAKGSEHSYRDPCRELIAAVAHGRLQATTTAAVIQEFAHVRARRRGRADAAALARDYGELLSPLLPITAESLSAGLRLFESTERLGAFDAVLAAAATTSGATALVSVDPDFAEVAALSHVIPDSHGVEPTPVNRDARIRFTSRHDLTAGPGWHVLA